jgi:hypothetical protein
MYTLLIDNRATEEKVVPQTPKDELVADLNKLNSGRGIAGGRL